MTVRLAVRRGLLPEMPRAEVLRRARAMMKALGLRREELSLAFVGDEEIHALNRDYRHKDKPTDVLAFAMREGAFGDATGQGGGDLLGDVIISVETARMQAARTRTTVESEITMLMAHGLLHLLGWDHDTPAKDRAMKKETARLCTAAEAAAAEGAAPQGVAIRELGRAAPVTGRKKRPGSRVGQMPVQTRKVATRTR